jgi:hypothetical protein
MMQGITVCTCVAGNYLAFARVLAGSLQRFHPGIPLHVLLADNQAPGETFQDTNVRVVRLGDLNVPGLRKLLLRYDCKQVLVAMKPALLRYMLESGYETVVYLDADMLVTASLDPVFQTVSGHSLSLTPHVGPAFAQAASNGFERTLLHTGMYNGGFVGVTNREESRRFLAWWEERLRTHCVEALRQGLHYDQRWLDMAPALVADLRLLRDPGCNVAYWNLPDLDVRAGRGEVLVGDSPLRLFHFSGFDPAQPEQVTRHAPALRVEEMGPAAELFRRYAALLDAAGWAETIRKPWPWDGWRKVLRRVRRRLSRKPLD